MKIPFTNKEIRFLDHASTELSRKPTLGDVVNQKAMLPEQARIYREINDRMMRMYDAAVTSNLNMDFPATITSANAEILVSIMIARSRARKLERDNAYTAGILQTFQNNVAGHDPFRLEMTCGKYDASGKFQSEPDLNRKIEEAWRKAGRIENCAVSRNMSRLELYLQAATSMIRCGGVLARHWRYFPHNKFAYAIEPIEIDRLDHNYNRPQGGQGGNEIQFSIEMDEFHAPLKYHLLTRHPGDIFAWSNSTMFREPVPAKDIIALFDIRTRPGQLIGMPRFASVIQHLHRINQFDIAHVTAAIWSSCKPFFFTQEFPTAMEYVPDFIKAAIEKTSETSRVGEKIASVEPAQGEVLPFGMKPVFSDPRFPIEAATGFKKDNLRAVAAGSGAPYMHIAQDLEAVNFSSGRLGLDEFRETCKILQEHMIQSYVFPYFRTWLFYAILSRQVDVEMSRYEELVDAASFCGKRWGYINPLQDVQADILAKEAGFKSCDQIIRASEDGGTKDSVNDQIAADLESDKAHGLDFSGESQSTKPNAEGKEPEGDTPPASIGKAAKSGGKQTLKKQRGINYEQLETTLRILHTTDPEFAATGEYDAFMDFKRARNGSLIH